MKIKQPNPTKNKISDKCKQWKLSNQIPPTKNKSFLENKWRPFLIDDFLNYYNLGPYCFANTRNLISCLPLIFSSCSLSVMRSPPWDLAIVSGTSLCSNAFNAACFGTSASEGKNAFHIQVYRAQSFLIVKITNGGGLGSTTPFLLVTGVRFKL